MSAIVDVNGQSRVRAQPMTAETKAGADVYVKAKSKDGPPSHDEETTANVNTGQSPTKEVAVVIVSGV